MYLSPSITALQRDAMEGGGPSSAFSGMPEAEIARGKMTCGIVANAARPYRVHRVPMKYHSNQSCHAKDTCRRLVTSIQIYSEARELARWAALCAVQELCPLTNAGVRDWSRVRT